jgi:hypothetical protein
MKGGWSGVPESETSEVGPSEDNHSMAMTVTKTSEEAVGERISIRFNLTPKDNLERPFPTPMLSLKPTDNRFRRKPRVIAKPVRAPVAINLN